MTMDDNKNELYKCDKCGAPIYEDELYTCVDIKHESMVDGIVEVHGYAEVVYTFCYRHFAENIKDSISFSENKKRRIFNDFWILFLLVGLVIFWAYLLSTYKNDGNKQTSVVTVVPTTTTLPSPVVAVTSEEDGVQRLVVDGLPCVKINTSMTCDWSKSAN